MPGTSISDTAGNLLTSATVSGSNQSYNLDTTTPTYAITYSRTAPLNAGAVTVTVTANETLSAAPTISINQPGTTDISSASTSGSGPYTSSVALTYAISSSVPANATAAGNLTFSSSLSRPVTVGDIVVVKAVTTESTALSSALSLALDGSRTITALETYTTSTSVGTTYFTHTVASGNDGTVTVSVTGPDTAGNAAVASGTTTFAIDTTAPSVALTYAISSSVPANATA
ncbi:MAG: hypothetical protein EBT22_12770, partial [Chloroflexi bacterium]|nr:hypothetical protein [Chloroflexota bacterium]